MKPERTKEEILLEAANDYHHKNCFKSSMEGHPIYYFLAGAKWMEEHHPTPPADQDSLWMAVCIECCPIEKMGVINVIKNLKKRFKISELPPIEETKEK